jgi:hypothetical protein
VKLALVGLTHHQNGVEQADARQTLADSLLRKLFDVKAIRLPAKHNSFGQHLDAKVTNTAIGRLVDDVFQLGPLHSLSPFFHASLQMLNGSPTKEAIRANFAGKLSTISGHIASRPVGCKGGAKS